MCIEFQICKIKSSRDLFINNVNILNTSNCTFQNGKMVNFVMYFFTIKNEIKQAKFQNKKAMIELYTNSKLCYIFLKKHVLRFIHFGLFRAALTFLKRLQDMTLYKSMTNCMSALFLMAETPKFY